MELPKDGANKKKVKNWTPVQKEVEGVPICEKYKYLGTILTPKLTCGEQISFIRRKSAYVFIKLYPYLKNASADARRDMWQTMIRPLFDSAFVLLEYEPSKSQKKNLISFWRTTFKQFLMVSKRISTSIVEEMMGCDLEENAKNIVVECKKQWEQRKQNGGVNPKKRVPKSKNLLRAVPNTWCKLLNTQVTPCVKCKKSGVICTSWHMKVAHGIELKDVKEIWKDEICKLTRQDKEKVKRKEIEEELTPLLQRHLDAFNKELGRSD